MRRTIALLLAILLLAPGAPARDKTNWDNLKKLKRGTRVLVTLWNGDQLDGRLESVSDTALSVTSPDRTDRRVGWTEEAERRNVRRVVRWREPEDLPDPQKVMLIGTAAGIAVGGITGGILDATHHNEGRAVGYAFGGGVIGFLGSVVVLGATGAVAVARGIRREVVVYEDKSRQPSKS